MGNNAGTREIGETFSLILTSTFSRGGIYGLKENPDYDVEITSRVTETTATSIKSETYKTVRQNGQVISSERINKDTYKRH